MVFVLLKRRTVMEYVYICQTHGYFSKKYKNKPRVEAVCAKCNNKCRVVQEKDNFLKSQAYKEELAFLFK